VDRREVLKRLAALGLVASAMAVERTYFFGPWAPEEPPKLWGDGVQDDAVALQWYLDHGRQIPRGIYHSSTDKLKFPPGELVSGLGVFLYKRVGDPTTAAFIKDFRPWPFENPRYDEATRKRWREWLLGEATQKRWLEREATGVREVEPWQARTEESAGVLRNMAKHATPDEVDAAARLLGERDFEALDQLPAVDYRGLTLEHACESLYRTVLEADAAAAARRVRARRARYRAAGLAEPLSSASC
jgi:hypothetical protein